MSDDWMFAKAVVGGSLAGYGYQVRTKYSTHFMIAGGAIVAWMSYDWYADDPAQ